MQLAPRPAQRRAREPMNADVTAHTTIHTTSMSTDQSQSEAVRRMAVGECRRHRSISRSTSCALGESGRYPHGPEIRATKKGNKPFGTPQMLVPKLGSARAALLQLATRQTSDERGPCALADERAPCALAEVPKGAHVSRKCWASRPYARRANSAAPPQHARSRWAVPVAPTPSGMRAEAV